MLHFDHAYQKQITNLQTMPKIFDIVMPMYDLLKYSDNYYMTTEGFWNYYRDEINDDANGNNIANNRINKNKRIKRKFFEYKVKLIGSTPNNNNTFEAEVVVPLKYLSNFLIWLDLPLINCEMNNLLEQIQIWNNSTTKNISLDYLIHPALRNITRLFVLSFKDDNDDLTRNSFDKYFIPLVEIKDLMH